MKHVHLLAGIALATASAIGAVGVSGAPGGGKDEVTAKVGLDKVADQLK